MILVYHSISVESLNENVNMMSIGSSEKSYENDFCSFY